MRHARRRDDMRAQDLKRERVNVWQARAVGHGGKPVGADNGVELSLGTGLNGRVGGHEAEESVDGADSRVGAA